jgi:hypothetical protein
MDNTPRKSYDKKGVISISSNENFLKQNIDDIINDTRLNKDDKIIRLNKLAEVHNKSGVDVKNEIKKAYDIVSPPIGPNVVQPVFVPPVVQPPVFDPPVVDPPIAALKYDAFVFNYLQYHFINYDEDDFDKHKTDVLKSFIKQIAQDYFKVLKSYENNLIENDIINDNNAKKINMDNCDKKIYNTDDGKEKIWTLMAALLISKKARKIIALSLHASSTNAKLNQIIDLSRNGMINIGVDFNMPIYFRMKDLFVVNKNRKQQIKRMFYPSKFYYYIIVPLLRSTNNEISKFDKISNQGQHFLNSNSHMDYNSRDIESSDSEEETSSVYESKENSQSSYNSETISDNENSDDWNYSQLQI